MNRFFVYFTIFMFCFLFAGNYELKADNIKQIGNLQWSNKTPFTLSQPEAKNYCHDLREGGHNDWRLPTISELRTLIQNCPATETNGTCKVKEDRFLYEQHTKGCSGCFVDPNKDINYGKLSKLKDRENLWSSSSLADNPGTYAFYVRFDDGRVTFAGKTSNFNARCVRNAKIDGIEEEKKISIKTFKEVDKERWSERSLKKMDLNTAKQYCANLNEDENGGWRLPNIDELRTLIRYCPKTQTNGACKPSKWDGNCHCNSKFNNGGYYSKLGDDNKVALWSSSYAYNSLARQNTTLIVDFDDAGIYPTGATGGHLPEYYVRCFWDPQNPNLKPKQKTTAKTEVKQDLQWSEKSRGTLEKAISYCENLAEGGFNDWRLPTISELRTLIQNCPATQNGGECELTDSCLSDSDCFNNACKGCGPRRGEVNYNKLGDNKDMLLSSSLRSDNRAWGIDFRNGSVRRVAFTANFRCVRNSSNSDSKKSTNSKNKKEAAKTEKLQWSEKAPKTMEWDDAMNYCKNLNEGGHNDWRLPNINELRTLIQNCPATQSGGECKVTDSCLSYSDCRNDACNGCSSDSSGGHSKFGDTRWFWSSSVRSDNSDKTWGVSFDDGGVSFGSKSTDDYVRCVRNAE